MIILVSVYVHKFFPHDTNSTLLYPQNLQREADRRKPQQDKLSETHRELTELNPELTAKAEVTLKLESVRTPYNDLCHKLGIFLCSLFSYLSWLHYSFAFHY